MPLYNPPADFSQAVGFYGVPAVARSTGYVNNFNLMDKVLPNYTATPVSSSFTGGLLDLLQAARLTDLNTTRLAVENLRVFAEAMAKQHDQLVNDLKACGLIG